jgi:hypothetical protein
MAGPSLAEPGHDDDGEGPPDLVVTLERLRCAVIAGRALDKLHLGENGPPFLAVLPPWLERGYAMQPRRSMR